jgi:hypothetical protein
MSPKIKLLGTAVRPVLGGVFVFLLLVMVYLVTLYFGLTGWQSIWDDFAGGVIVAVLLYIDERRRRRALAEQLQIIALMNHHVRNALQAIKYARYTPDDVRVLEDAVARIEWALREILPGAKAGVLLQEATRL